MTRNKRKPSFSEVSVSDSMVPQTQIGPILPLLYYFEIETLSSSEPAFHKIA